MVSQKWEKAKILVLSCFIGIKWLWLVAGNRYLQCNGIKKVVVFDEVGGLTICWGWGRGSCIKCF